MRTTDVLLKPVLHRLWLPLAAVLIGSTLAAEPERIIAHKRPERVESHRPQGCLSIPHYGVNDQYGHLHCCLLAY